MFIIDTLRLIIGKILIEQNGTEIRISGLSTQVMQNDIAKVWHTSRIKKHLFTEINRYSLSFNVFFAPDVLYMMQTLLNHSQGLDNRRTIAAIIELMLSATWLKDITMDPVPRVDYRRIKRLIYQPLDYQEQFIKQYDKLTQQYHLNGYLLAATAGSGKTYIALALAETLSVEKLIIISPKNAIRRVWESEVKKLFKREQSYWLIDDKQAYKKERIIISHYETLPQVLDLAKSFRRYKTMIVLDESHNLNGHDSLRTERFLDLVKLSEAKDVLYQSGTPLKAMGSELAPFLRAIDPMFTPEVEKRFKRIYGANTPYGNEILESRMGLLSFKVEKHQLGLAPPIMHRINIKIPTGDNFTLSQLKLDMKDYIKKQTDFYAKSRQVDSEFYYKMIAHYEATLTSSSERRALAVYQGWVSRIQQMKGDVRQVGEEVRLSNLFEKEKIIPTLNKQDVKAFKRVKSLIKYTRLVIMGESLGRVVGRKRIDCHVALSEYVPWEKIVNSTEKKTLVFTSFVDALESSRRHITALGLTPLSVYGKTNKDLNAIIERYDKDYNANPLLATYQSLSTAVPLVMADTVIMLDAPFRDYIREQAISRVHRLKADTQVVVHEIFLDTGDEPNISTRSKDILKWSQEQVESIMGIESPFKVEEENSTLIVATESADIQYSYSLYSDLVKPNYLEW